jgi:iron complex outermembrane receptor protein
MPNLKALRYRSVFFATSALCATLAAGGARADDAPAPATVAPAATGAVEEVVVTAERRSTSSQNTAISMTAVSGDKLVEAHVNTIADVQNVAPGLSVTNSGLTQNVNIRGLGNTAVSPNITTGVAVFRDGLYEPEAILLSEPMYDIADVEVLKGPQGTIIGQNSTGGALTINSKNPNFGGVNGYAEAQFGSYNDRKFDGAVNLPINDVLAARMAFNWEQRDSFYKDIGGQLAQGTDNSNVQPGKMSSENARIGIIYRPNDDFQAVLKAEFNQLDTGGYDARPLPFSAYYSYGYNGPSIYNNFRTLGPWQLAYDFTGLEDLQMADRYGLDMKYRLNNGITIRSMTGIQHTGEKYNSDTDYSEANAAVVGSVYTVPGNSAGGAREQYHNIGPADNYYSEELDIISPDSGRLTWLAGASYFYRNTAVHDRTYDGTGVNNPLMSANPAFNGTNSPFSFTCPTNNCNLYSLSDTDATQLLLGVFGQLDYKLLDNLHLVVGARESIDKNTTTGYTVANIDAQLANGGSNYSYTNGLGTYNKSVPTYKVTLNWTPMPGQLVYAFAARGYKEGGINNTVIPDFQPEYVNDYEIGWKGRLLDGAVLTQVGGYYMQYTGIQQQVVATATGGNYVANLGASTIYGVEAAFQAHVQNFRWDAGFAYNYSSLGSVSAVGTWLLAGNGATLLKACSGAQLTQVAPGASSTAIGCTNYTGTIVSLAGEQDPYSPTYQFNTSLSYDFDVPGGILTPRVGVSYTGQQWASIFQKIPTGINPNAGLDKNGNPLPYPNNSIPAHTLVDLSLGYHAKEWTIEVFGKNVTNLYYLAGIAGNNGFYGDPATWGIRLNRTF